MDEASLFKFSNETPYHVTLSKILNAFSISGIDDATLFKFGKYLNIS